MQATCKEARPSRQEAAAPLSVQDENIIPAATYEDEVSRMLDGAFPPVGTSDDAAALIGVKPAAMREFCRPALLRFMLGGAHGE